MSKKYRNLPSTLQQPAVRTTTQIAQFSGPLPHPDILARYNEVFPGAAERIVAMAEKDSTHLQEMERKSLEGALMERRLGQALGFGIGLAGFATGIALGYLGQGNAAAVVGGATLIGLVSIFVAGRIYPKSD